MKTKKYLVVYLGILLVAVASAAVFSGFSVVDASIPAYTAPTEVVNKDLTFTCGGDEVIDTSTRRGSLKANDIDDLDLDDITRFVSKYCKEEITNITDWDGNKLRTYGNPSIETITTFNVAEGQEFDCIQRGYNWTGSQCDNGVAIG